MFMDVKKFLRWAVVLTISADWQQAPGQEKNLNLGPLGSLTVKYQTENGRPPLTLGKFQPAPKEVD